MKIEVWSDVACPWCYIGKRRLEAAVEVYGKPVEITWKSFQLDSTIAPDAVSSHDEMLAKKYNRTLDEVAEMNERVTSVAAEEGLDYALDKYLVVNTRDAHRLSHFAKAKGLGPEMHERLFKAQLEEGAALNEADVLAGLGAEVGLNADEVRAMLAGGDFDDAVQDDIAEAAALGASGVPFFVFNRKVGFSGAQPAEAFARAFAQAE